MRMQNLYLLDAAQDELKSELAKEHKIVELLRGQESAASTALMRALRQYQVHVTKGAADLHGADHVMLRLQALIAYCNMGMDAPKANRNVTSKAVDFKPLGASVLSNQQMQLRQSKGSSKGVLSTETMKRVMNLEKKLKAMHLISANLKDASHGSQHKVRFLLQQLEAKLVSYIIAFVSLYC